jgi:uncharacterized membrane protein
MLTIWKKIKSNIRANLIPGMIVVVPIVISILVLRWLINFFDNLLRPIVENFLHIYIPGIGLLLSIIFIYLVGLSTKNYFGNKFIQLGEWFVIRIPVAKTVYTAVKQIITTLTTRESNQPQKVVIIEYPRNGIYSIGLFNGFIDDPATGEKLGSILIITSINPASGFTVLVPFSQIRFTDLSLDKMMKYIVSGGIVIPENFKIVPYVLKKKNNE